MFCTQCGTQNPEGVNTCTNCGATLGAETSEAPAKKPSFDPVALFNQFRASKYFVPGCAAGACLILVIILLIALGGNGMTKPIDRYLKGRVKADVETYMSAYPEEYLEYIDEYWNIDIYEDTLESWLESMEDDIGDKIKVKYEITDKDEMDEDDLDDLKDYLHNRYDMARRDLTEAWEIEIEVTYKGADDDETDELEFTVIKYDGKWYLCP